MNNILNRRKVISPLNSSCLISLVLYCSILLIFYNREDIIKFLSEYKSKLYPESIAWVPPPRNRIKGNTDGACKGNSGRSFYGFCLRNFTGNLIYAQGEVKGNRTNLEAEIIAMIEALRYCKKVELKEVIMETDSPSLSKFLQEEWKVPWERVELIEECIQLIIHTKARIQHTLKEGNQMADYIANYALEVQEVVQFQTF